MPCYHPLQAKKIICSDGSTYLDFKMRRSGEDVIRLPCGKCIGCRLENSRQWAVRMSHEASLHTENCFLTLTYAPEFLPENGSLVKSDVQKFLKRLRRKFSEKKILNFYCGEYGEQFCRPHYHLCLFNFDFSDKKRHSVIKGNQYYVSDICKELWPFGNHFMSEFTFETAAYVARYCTKKINGAEKKKHYGDRIPEFAHMSKSPAIGLKWIEKYGESDVFPFDEVVCRGRKMKPPRYYDKYLEKVNPDRYEQIKAERIEKMLDKQEDNSYERLQVKEVCQKARMRSLEREYEKQYT